MCLWKKRCLSIEEVPDIVWMVEIVLLIVPLYNELTGC